MALANAENNQTGNGTVYTMLWAKSDVIDQVQILLLELLQHL